MAGFAGEMPTGGPGPSAGGTPESGEEEMHKRGLPKVVLKTRKKKAGFRDQMSDFGAKMSFFFKPILFLTPFLGPFSGIPGNEPFYV